MSSKVLLPGDSRPVGRMEWRRISVSPDSPGKEPPASPDRLAEVEMQCQQRVRDAHAAGLREGEIAARNHAAAEMQPVVERLGRSIQELANLRARLRREAESDVVQLALAIARRILRREVAIDPDALRGLVVAALEKLQAQEVSRVKVHPSHVPIVTACLQQALGGRHVEVLPDPSREPGAVIFETARGNLDASVDSLLHEIERGLADRLRKQS